MTLRPLLTTLRDQGRQTPAQLAAALSRQPEMIAHQLHILFHLGLVDVAGDAYGLTAEGLEWLGNLRRPGQRRYGAAKGLPAAVWAWLRIHRKGTANDMLTVIGTADSAAGNLRRYLRALVASGHLTPMQRGGVETRYLLTRDTGRAAPQHRRQSGAVYDPNTGETHPIHEVEA